MSLKTAVVNSGLSALHFLNSNSPRILSGLAILGTVLTAVSSVEAYKQTTEAINEQREEVKKEDPKFTDFSRKEKFGMSWYYWIKVVLIGGATIGCIFGAQSINDHRRLEMIASYNLLREGAEKFEKYAVDEIGKNKVNKIKHQIHEDEIKEDIKKRGLTDAEISSCDAETGGALFKDTYTGQIFPSTYERIYRAVDRVNDKLESFRTQDEKGNYNGGLHSVSVASFIEDCGGEYSSAAEKYVFSPLPFDRALPSKKDICDPCVMEYKGHMCTIVQLNYVADNKDLYPPIFDK